MTDLEAESLGKELAELTALGSNDVDRAILISLGRAAVKLAEPYVLEKLREPTEAMIVAGNAKTNFNTTVFGCHGSEDASCDAFAEFDSAAETWQAMIDARLEEVRGERA